MVRFWVFSEDGSHGTSCWIRRVRGRGINATARIFDLNNEEAGVAIFPQMRKPA